MYLIGASNNGEGDNRVSVLNSVPSGAESTWSSLNFTALGSNYPLYVKGLTTDTATGALWAWDAARNVYTNDSASYPTQPPFPSVFVALNDYLMAVAEAPYFLALYDENLGNCAGPPTGDCLFLGNTNPPSTNPGEGGVGGVQLTIDAVTHDSYLLDANGRIWSAGEISDSQCSSGTVVFVQIAAKNGVIYGLDEHGTVWYYGGVKGACWAEVGNGAKTAFAVSIAADNAAGSGTEIWASDNRGVIWAAE